MDKFIVKTPAVPSCSTTGKTKSHPTKFDCQRPSRKICHRSRMIEIQVQLSQRAIELLNLPEDKPCFLLDIGCGSGLSGEVLTEEGHHWIGLDISQAMLDVAVEREVEGDLFLHDVGQGLFFKPGTFDGCISISALQWLCNADKKSHNPAKRLGKFFSSLYSAMSRGGRAVFQFYPENPQQVELITTQAMKAGFTGGLVVDYPNSTRAKKIFLCLFAGVVVDKLPKGLGTEETKGVQDTVQFTGQRERTRVQRGKPVKKSKDWIKEKKERRRRQGNIHSYNTRHASFYRLPLCRTNIRERTRVQRRKPVKKSKDWIKEKKERRRRQGKEVRPDSKYTGRKRKSTF